MKQKFRRLLAVFFTIAMVLGLVPLMSEGVEAALTYENTVIAIDEFADEGKLVSNITDIDKFIRSQFGSSVRSNTHPYTIGSNKSEFKKAWNKMAYKQTVVVIDTHGCPTSVCGMTTSDINSLPYKQITYIVLLGCNAGHYDWRTENVARTFAEKFRCTVIACDGTVSSVVGTNRVYKPCSGGVWEMYCSQKRPSRRNMYGWLAYVPKNSSNNYQGKLYQIGQMARAMSVYDMLTIYSKGNVTSLPVK